MTAPVTDNCKEYSCMDCDKFQPLWVAEVWEGAGECRALSPLQFEIAPAAPKDDPLFAAITWAPYTWCAAWKRKNGAALPTPVPPI